MQRVVVYIDGFNLYRGIKDSGWQQYLWLNLHSLGEKLCHRAEQKLSLKQQLVRVRYFTTPVKNRAKEKRQRIYLDALRTFPRSKLTLHFGKYVQRGNSWEEKMTDVNLAVELTCDAFNNLFDTAIIVSGDTDFVGLIKAVRNRFHNKQVVVAFPPKRDKNISLKHASSSSFTISMNDLLNSQFPNEVPKRDGSKLIRPPEWR